MKSMGNTVYKGTQDSLNIDSVMFIETFVLNGNDRMLHIQRNLADRYRHTVGVRSGEFLKLIAVCIVYEGGIAAGHDIYIGDIR